MSSKETLAIPTLYKEMRLRTIFVRVFFFFPLLISPSENDAHICWYQILAEYGFWGFGPHVTTV